MNRVYEIESLRSAGACPPPGATIYKARICFERFPLSYDRNHSGGVYRSEDDERHAHTYHVYGGQAPALRVLFDALNQYVSRAMRVRPPFSLEKQMTTLRNVNTRIVSKMFHVFIYLIAGLSMACQIDTSPKIGESKDSVDVVRPALVDVPESDVEIGFTNGRIRKKVSLDGFRITKHPITVEQYKACMKAGACEEPAENACAAKIDQLSQEESANSDASPVLCAGHEQAKAYCDWVGGELPNLNQWLLAARGEKPKLFSWGDEPPQCDQHPMARKIRSYVVSRLPRSRARALLDKSNKKNRCETKRKKLFDMTTGEHPTGASPFGVEDVLITPGELIRPDKNSRFSACGSRTHGCVAFGQFPGVIDSVEPVYFYKRKQKEGEAKTVSSVIHPYGFRCVFEEE